MKYVFSVFFALFPIPYLSWWSMCLASSLPSSPSPTSHDEVCVWCLLCPLPHPLPLMMKHVFGVFFALFPIPYLSWWSMCLVSSLPSSPSPTSHDEVRVWCLLCPLPHPLPLMMKYVFGVFFALFPIPYLSWSMCLVSSLPSSPSPTSHDEVCVWCLLCPLPHPLPLMMKYVFGVFFALFPIPYLSWWSTCLVSSLPSSPSPTSHDEVCVWCLLCPLPHPLPLMMKYVFGVFFALFPIPYLSWWSMCLVSSLFSSPSPTSHDEVCVWCLLCSLPHPLPLMMKYVFGVFFALFPIPYLSWWSMCLVSSLFSSPSPTSHDEVRVWCLLCPLPHPLPLMMKYVFGVFFALFPIPYLSWWSMCLVSSLPSSPSPTSHDEVCVWCLLCSLPHPLPLMMKYVFGVFFVLFPIPYLSWWSTCLVSSLPSSPSPTSHDEVCVWCLLCPLPHPLPLMMKYVFSVFFALFPIPYLSWWSMCLVSSLFSSPSPTSHDEVRVWCLLCSLPHPLPLMMKYVFSVFFVLFPIPYLSWWSMCLVSSLLSSPSPTSHDEVCVWCLLCSLPHPLPLMMKYVFGVFFALFPIPYLSWWSMCLVSSLPSSPSPTSHDEVCVWCLLCPLPHPLPLMMKYVFGVFFALFPIPYLSWWSMCLVSSLFSSPSPTSHDEVCVWRLLCPLPHPLPLMMKYVFSVFFVLFPIPYLSWLSMCLVSSLPSSPSPTSHDEVCVWCLLCPLPHPLPLMMKYVFGVFFALFPIPYLSWWSMCLVSSLPSSPSPTSHDEVCVWCLLCSLPHPLPLMIKYVFSVFFALFPIPYLSWLSMCLVSSLPSSPSPTSHDEVCVWCLLCPLPHPLPLMMKYVFSVFFALFPIPYLSWWSMCLVSSLPSSPSPTSHDEVCV